MVQWFTAKRYSCSCVNMSALQPIEVANTASKHALSDRRCNSLQGHFQFHAQQQLA